MDKDRDSHCSMVSGVVEDLIATLPCWTGAIEIAPLAGGLTNANFLVTQASNRFVVRLASDILEHNILRWQEVMASKAAHAAGISPEVFHSQDGALVIQYIDGRTLTPQDVRQPANLKRIVELLHRCHDDVPRYWVGPILAVWPFQVVRSYGLWLSEHKCRLASEWPRLLKLNDQLEKAVGPVALKFNHNDLLAANFIDDGSKLWLIDWEYAGLNSELFDLAGLSVNNTFTNDQEDLLLEAYFEEFPTRERKQRYLALMAASALREAAWSMVQEEIATLDEDYQAYTQSYLERLETALERLAL